MSRIGCICPELSGHLNPTIAVAKELQRRGNDVSFIARADAESKVSAAGFEFISIGEREYPIGSVPEFEQRLGESSGRDVLGLVREEFAKLFRLQLEELPEVYSNERFDGLLIDQLSIAAVSAAQYRQLPFVTQANALMMNQDAFVPPPAVPWLYLTGMLGRIRNAFGWSMFNRFFQPLMNVLDEKRKEQNLEPYWSVEELRSPFAEISQSIREFEFPRKSLADTFHFVGPLVDERARPDVDFPFNDLDDRPLIYASMGTLQNRLGEVFRTIVEACDGIGLQLVVSFGGADLDIRSELPDWPVVVDYAPQLELLRRASLTITHAGMNTVLESLANGVPMVAIPVANEQPGIASRISYARVGESLSLSRLTPTNLRDAVKRVLHSSEVKEKALAIQNSISNSGGVSMAADIVEQAIKTNQPVRNWSKDTA